VTGRPYLCRSTKIKRAPGGTPRLRSGGVELYQNGQLGGFAETMLVHEHALVRIDPEMPLDRAALLACGTMTGVGAVFNTAKVAAGATVAVIGCGAVGLNVLQGAAIAGASRVIAVDLLASKLEGRTGARDHRRPGRRRQPRRGPDPSGPRDIVITGPGEVHWHGAGPNAPMSHLAVSRGTTT
jgi:Zn-dependent alcohol dehydrogenase